MGMALVVNAMQERNDEKMSDKLFDLCEQQLLSIIGDAEASIAKIVNSTTTAVNESAELHEKIADAAALSAENRELCEGLQHKVGAILTSMQCFDEITQRIQHIKEIVQLIKLESDRDGFLDKPRCSDELVNDISNIFSIRSEFEVLEQIFPESRKNEPSEMVELF